MEYHYTAYPSPFGSLYLLASPKGLIGASLNETLAQFKKRFSPLVEGDLKEIEPRQHPILNSAIIALDFYFKKGKPIPNVVPLDLRGSDFQIKVWKALRRINYGKTASYGQIAEKIGLPNGARAVGTACGSNPVPLFVPCHRVLAGDGSLGGYAYGLDLKQKLLVKEGVKMQK